MSGPTELRVPFESGGAAGTAATAPPTATSVLVYPAHARTPVGATLILAHGAGAGQQSAFMVEYARGLSALGLDIVTFDFPYMAQGRRLPDRAPVLEACYRAVIAAVRREVDTARRTLCIGGKSMGGRMATHIAAADHDGPIAGLVLFGYPLHPPKRPAAMRTAHLPAIRLPMLFVHGSRDGFGTPDELRAAVADLVPPPTVHIVTGADHSLTVLKSAATPQAAVAAAVQRAVVEWVALVSQGSPAPGHEALDRAGGRIAVE